MRKKRSGNAVVLAALAANPAIAASKFVAAALTSSAGASGRRRAVRQAADGKDLAAAPGARAPRCASSV
jgi:hypothetical protein